MEFENRIRRKKNKEKIVMLTAYDFQMAKILDSVGIDMILVGDSLGMVFQGFRDTRSVTIEDMIYHTKAVARGAAITPIIGDMPVCSDRSIELALRNSSRLLEAGAKGVKIEGHKREIIQRLVEEGIPVMGHLGLLPQTANVYKVQGKDPKEAQQIFQDALNLDQYGVFSIILECVPESLAEKITKAVRVPTIGIGAGKHCDGQVLVVNDMLGLLEGFKPKYLKRYLCLNKLIKKAIETFAEDVRSEKYPDEEHTYH